MTREDERYGIFGLWLLALVLTVIGAHLWVVWLYGSPLPFWDQWDEAFSLFKPWQEGRLTWADVAAPDSDHRIILTHFLDMGLIRLNGRWDPLLEMTVNAFLHAAVAAGLAFCLWHFGGRKSGGLVCALLLPFFALPYAGENAIWGLNSLWYLINIFGPVSLVGLGFFRAGSWPWWLGLVAALLALLTMALGPVAPMAIVGLMLLRYIKSRRFDRQNLITAGICLVLTAIGLALSVRQGGFRPLQAHSVAEFIGALIRHLDWPFYKWPAMACVILLPLAALLVYYFRPNVQASRAAEFLIVLALWSVLQSVILAYGRANYGDKVIPGSRYMEVFSLLLIASLFAILQLAELWRGGNSRNWAGLLLLIFAGSIFWGLWQMSNIVVDNLLVQTRVMNLVAEERIATLLATDDEKAFLDPPTVLPDPKVALAVLRDPKLQMILPVACVSPAEVIRPGWLSMASHCLLRHSMAMVGGGLALAVGLCGWSLIRKSREMTLKKADGVFLLLAAWMAVGFVSGYFWSKQDLSRKSIEYAMQTRLAEDFKSAGDSNRAAFHARKADALKP